MDRFEQALEFLKRQQFEKAKEILEELLKEDPTSIDILYNLGMCYTELGDPETAIKMLAECVRYSPHYSNAYVAIGFAHSELGHFEEAKMFFSKALEIDPYNSYALRNLGGIYGKEGNHHKAIECLMRLIWTDYRNPVSRKRRGFVFEIVDHEKNSILDYCAYLLNIFFICPC
jgi:tetratricopeptide (TPR) repeat protein